MLRTAWRRLTSMRTALILLFLLAVAAVPGSLLPQRPLNPSKTSSYIRSHGSWGTFLDRIGMFDVFGSVWFAAIYLLLFISLVGCLIPRIKVHARAMVRKPLPAPRHLSKLPESARFEIADEPAVYAAAAREALGRRWRVTERTEGTGAITLSAEKGYSRETGNLIFHVALLAALLLIAIGRLYSYQGTRIVTQGAGQGFCNTISQYDSWQPGRFAAEGKISPAPFCIDELSKFTATYGASGEPTEFAADVTYRPTLGSAARRTTITVNHPLRLEGDRVYLIGHGFAPSITVRMPDGKVVHDNQVFVPTNATTLYSEGAFKEQGIPGANKDVGITGFFAPTPVETSPGVFTSSSPKVDNPVLGIFVYVGDLNANGQPQSVYTLDTTKMKKIGAVNLRQGETRKLSNGVQVTFDGWVPWASLQVSHDPAQGYLLVAAVAMVIGLFGSLGVRRRRLWLRIAPARGDGGSSPTVVDVGGLARSDSGNFTAEFAAWQERLRQAATPTQEMVTGSQGAVSQGAGAGKD
ncbi:MAG TPA: cytochrome c biogenesis protein ResB [Jatrophihabitans sp.]|uniref:cytochrome c biogenesis protein ResB n=1 Tax=Jatrophihabitans sp. TaxID=1932789 RepID=UPI002DFFEFD2|nr:cytochrome c biogenesis protein ResB [Jatrophihabitans sp.]